MVTRSIRSRKDRASRPSSSIAWAGSVVRGLCCTGTRGTTFNPYETCASRTCKLHRTHEDGLAALNELLRTQKLTGKSLDLVGGVSTRNADALGAVDVIPAGSKHSSKTVFVTPNITPIYPLYTLLYYSSFHVLFHYPYIIP